MCRVEPGVEACQIQHWMEVEYGCIFLVLSCCSRRGYTLRKHNSVLTAIFPGEPELPSVIEAKDDGSGGDNWSYKSCKAPVKSSPSTNQHPTF